MSDDTTGMTFVLVDYFHKRNRADMFQFLMTGGNHRGVAPWADALHGCLLVLGLSPVFGLVVIVCPSYRQGHGKSWLYGDFSGGSPAVALAGSAGISATCTFEHTPSPRLKMCLCSPLTYSCRKTVHLVRDSIIVGKETHLSFQRT